jgi:hypothetical protein
LLLAARREILTRCSPTRRLAAPTTTGSANTFYRTRNPTLFPHLRIPRSTTATWLRRRCPTVVSCDPPDDDVTILGERIETLEARVRRLAAIVGLQRALRREFGVSLENARLPAGSAKATVLDAVTRAKRTLPLGAILRILHLAPARYHAWQRANVPCQSNLDQSGV